MSLAYGMVYLVHYIWSNWYFGWYICTGNFITRVSQLWRWPMMEHNHVPRRLFFTHWVNFKVWYKTEVIDCVPQILGESNFLNWGPQSQRLGYGVKHNKFESRNISLSIPRVFDETKWIQISCWTNTHNSYLDLFSFSKLYLLVQFLFDRQSLWDITTLWDHTINRRPQLSCYAIFWRKIICKC